MPLAMLQLPLVISAVLGLALAIPSSACPESSPSVEPATQQHRAPNRGRAQNQGRASMIVCTPTTIKIGADSARIAKNPIAEAITAAAPGCKIMLQSGRYPGFTLGFGGSSSRSARSSGGLPGQPITIVGSGDVWIRADKSYGDTISINQEVKNGHFTFQNLKIEPGYRAAVLFFKQNAGKTHDGFKFLDCHILGKWNHTTEQGVRSKWGIWGHSMRDFEFRGVRAPARVENIQQEHGFYIQNAQGPILIENVRAKRLGRTFCQFTARAKDGPPGIGSITVRNCDVQDIGLFKDDNHKGGSAFTFAGRLTGEILVENNRYRAGFDAQLARLTRPGVPYGTGALVCWGGGEKVKNRKVTIKGNDFEFAKGCGDRPVVSIGGCGQVDVVGKNRFVAGGKEAALALDPLKGGRGSPPVSPPNDHVNLSPETEVVGLTEFRGRRVDPEQLQQHLAGPEEAPRRQEQRRR